MDYLCWIQVGIALVVGMTAAVIDQCTGSIPNRLTVPAILAGLSCGFVAGGVAGGGLALVGALLVGLVPLLLFRVGAMGGGDVKLFAAFGALLGAGPALEAELFAFVVGSVQGLILWIRAGCVRAGFSGVIGLVFPALRRRLSGRVDVGVARAIEIRFGPAIFFGVAVVVTGRILGIS
jgi:prepilin peptidase CpaA